MNPYVDWKKERRSGETLPYLLGLVLVCPQGIEWNLRLILGFRFAHYVIAYGNLPALRTVCSLSAWVVIYDGTKRFTTQNMGLLNSENFIYDV